MKSRQVYFTRPVSCCAVSLAALLAISLGSTVLAETIWPKAQAGSKLPPDFVYLRDVDPTILQEMRYAGYHNFVGRPITGYEAPECILTARAALQLKAVQEELLSASMTLKVYDCYRPQKGVDDFVVWSKDPLATQMKEEFYPTLEKDVLFPDGYIAEKSGHSRGSTVDITIVSLPPAQEPIYVPGQQLYPCTNPPSERWPDNSLNFGTGFDCFNPMAHTMTDLVTKEVLQRRQSFVQIMQKHGFKNYENEWWHFTLVNEPYPNTYFDFNIVQPSGARENKF